MDLNNNPAISYFDDDKDKLKLALWNGGWQITTLDFSNVTGFFTSIAFNNVGQVFIAYYDYSTSSLKYATWNSNAWIYEIIDSRGDVGWYPSIAIDPNGRPAISYYDATNGDLKYVSSMRSYAQFIPFTSK